MKKCIHCGKGFVHKYGLVNGIQRYKCVLCNKQFLGGSRLDSSLIWEDYTSGKQTYKQLSIKYNCSIKTIQRRIDAYKLCINPLKARKVIVLMDTTYWGRGFGVMLFKDAITKENLLKYYVKHESNFLYIQGVNELKDKGFDIIAIVCDGRKGLIQSFMDIPVQMCQFNQSAIIRRYLTKEPKLKAAQELMEIMDLMKKTDKDSFIGTLDLWHDKWEDFLDERTINSHTNKSFYTHKRLRSAYRSLKTNLPWLFI